MNEKRGKKKKDMNKIWERRIINYDDDKKVVYGFEIRIHSQEMRIKEKYMEVIEEEVNSKKKNDEKVTQNDKSLTPSSQFWTYSYLLSER